MSSDTTILRDILHRLERIEKYIKPTTGTWITESEAMQLTDLSKRSLQRLRKSGKIHWGTATGRKIKYSRKDIEKYLNDNSTLIN